MFCYLFTDERLPGGQAVCASSHLITSGPRNASWRSQLKSTIVQQENFNNNSITTDKVGRTKKRYFAFKMFGGRWSEERASTEFDIQWRHQQEGRAHRVRG